MYNYLKRKYINLISDKKFSEILTGSVWVLGARVVSASLGVAISVVVARIYGAEMVGIVAVTNSFLTLITTFTVLGTSTSILRLIPEHLSKYSPTSAFRVYHKSQFMVIGISVLTGAVSFMAADLIADKIFSKPHLSFYFSLAAVFIVFKSIMLLNTQAVRGLRLIRVFAVMQFLPQLFNLAFLIVIEFVWINRDVPVYAVLFSFFMTGAVGWVSMEYAFRKKMRVADKVHCISGRAILDISLPMLMTATMNFIIGQTGVFMLAMFRSEAEVGFYSIAVKLATLTVFIFQAVDSMVGPKFSELFYAYKMDDLFYVAKKSAKLIFFTTTPVLFCILIFGKYILNIVFGEEFTVAYVALVILVLGQFINSISGSTKIFMNMTGQQKTLRNIMVIAATLNIGFNLWLTPILGIRGAAVAAMVSLSFWNIVTLTYIKIKFGRTTGYFLYCG